MNEGTTGPRISVIMTVFDERPEWVWRATESILRQTFSDFECIIIDDGSSNGETLAELERLKEIADPRLRVIHQVNTGLAIALNRGIDLAKGEFMCRQDSDDWSELNRFEKQVAFMDANPDIGVVGAAVQLYDEESRAYGQLIYPTDPDEIKRMYPIGNPACHGTICARLSIIRRLGCYRADLSVFGEDYDLFWRMCDDGPTANLPDVLYHRLSRLSSMTATRSKDRRIAVEVVRKLGNSRAQGKEMPFSVAMEEAEAKDWSSAVTETTNADEMMRAGAFWQAFKRYLRALQQSPFYVKAWLKIARLAIYILCPWWRWRMFKEPYRGVRPPQKMYRP